MGASSKQGKHEEFQTKGATTNSNRPVLVRPERYGLADWQCMLKIGHNTYEILNYSSYGIALISNKEMMPLISGSVMKAEFILQNYPIQSLDLKFVYSEATGNDQVKIALEIVGNPLDVEQLNAALEGLSLTKTFANQSKEEGLIAADFRRAVLEIKEFFQELRSTLSEQEKHWSYLSHPVRYSREKGMGIVVAEYIETFLKDYYQVIENTMKKLVDGEKVNYLRFFRQKLEDFLWSAPMAHRAYHKPNGYAGDFEMMNLIYRDEFEGKDLFSKCLHKYYINQAAARSVKNRAQYLLAKIKKFALTSKSKSQPLRILSIASGSAFEIELFLKEWNPEYPKIQITLFDQDLKALQYAQHKLREVMLSKNIVNIEIHYLHLAIKNLIVNGMPDENMYDFIYSAGLFDYFSDNVANACMKQLFKVLKPSGKLLIGNFDVSNPTKGIMEIVLDWYLIYRTRDDLLRLAKLITDQVTVESEGEGLNLFVEMEKQAN
jgi:extracellular factor (EF) 3-hydroxypalmitic acid methyl ester biosynthesis protein